ncbi:MAG: SprT family zinc-dependent metalloprotease [Clostridia bacterium]
MMIAQMEIEIEKKKIKNLHLYVLPPDGRVRVTAPKSVSDAMIRAFVESKLAWIQVQQEKIQMRPRQAELQYVSGEQIPLWGKWFSIEVRTAQNKQDVIVDGDTVFLHARAESTLAQREALIHQWYREQMQYEIEPLLEKWQPRMGVMAESWGIKNMKTRWGTCNFRDRRIWLNLQLAKKDLLCLEYVVVHELAHLIVSNHSKEFKDVLSRFLPGWKDIKKTLV